MAEGIPGGLSETEAYNWYISHPVPPVISQWAPSSLPIDWNASIYGANPRTYSYHADEVAKQLEILAGVPVQTLDAFQRSNMDTLVAWLEAARQTDWYQHPEYAANWFSLGGTGVDIPTGWGDPYQGVLGARAAQSVQMLGRPSAEKSATTGLGAWAPSPVYGGFNVDPRTWTWRQGWKWL